MSKPKRIGAGYVLTKKLLEQVDKSAYQYGGFLISGAVVKKSAFNLQARTTVLIPKSAVKNHSLFIRDFQKTMNAYYYTIEFTDSI